MKDKLGGKIVKKFVGLRAKIYSEDKRAKGTKNYVIKRKLKFENHINSLEATQFDD